MELKANVLASQFEILVTVRCRSTEIEERCLQGKKGSNQSWMQLFPLSSCIRSSVLSIRQIHSIFFTLFQGAGSV